jgi:asparagine synthase (glutamine-hydrolysing)
MSGIAAIVTRGERPADLGHLRVMLDVMRDRGGDGRAVWTGAGIALGVEQRWTTPESVDEPQPFIDPRTGVVVVLDGRLDNRDELRASIGDAVSTSAGDAAYISAAYARWGTAMPERLVGDFALVLWDARDRSLFCARDIMGVRPFYYSILGDGTVLIASEPAALLATGVVPDDVNDARALEHLVDRAQHTVETLYRHIVRLPPAHTMQVSPAGVTHRRYWDFEPGERLRYRDDGEYAAHAREVLLRAVRAQTRAIGAAGILLSGGIDSSAVAVLAADAGIACEAVTTTFDGQACDEGPQAAAVAAACGFRWHGAPYRPRQQAWYSAQALRYRDLPDYPNGAMLEDARATARAAGVRVLLTGAGGDEWFTGSPYRYADWCASGAVARAAIALAGEVRVRGWRHPTREALLCGVWPLLPAPVRRGVKRTLGRRDALPAWIDAHAGARTNLLARVSARVEPRPGETFAQADLRALGTGGFRVHSDELEDRATARAGIEQRNPMYDRRVLEFAYALPDDQRWRGTTRKFVLRAAAGERLAPVRARADKAEFSDTYVDALPDGETDFPLMRARGWIEPSVVGRLHRQATAWRHAGDDRFWHIVGPLWMFHAMETWLAAASRRAYDRTASSDRWHESLGGSGWSVDAAQAV